jgi:hypothetical protein
MAAQNGASAMSPRRAFTLIELLGALLLPTLREARIRAKRTACATNLKQIGVGLRSYISDHNDRRPYASFMPSMGPFPLDTDEPIYLADVLLTHVGDEPAVFKCPNDDPDNPRPVPNYGLSYFESERSSYEYRVRPLMGGYTIKEIADRMERFVGHAISDNMIWIMRDYDNFHGEGGKDGARRYWYIDGHVTDYEH